MPVIARDNPSEFIPAPAGMHPARLVDVLDMGVQRKESYGRTVEQHRARLVFQIDKRFPGNDDVAFTVSHFVNLTLNEKGALRPFLTSWFGRPISDREASEGIDLESLVGQMAYVQLIHVERAGKTYANINTIIPLPEGLTTSFPDYIKGTTGEIVLEASLPSPPAAASMANGTPSGITPQPRAHTPNPASSASGKPSAQRIAEVQQRGAALFNGRWPATRDTILEHYGIDGLEIATGEELDRIEEYLAGVAEEMVERRVVQSAHD